MDRVPQTSAILALSKELITVRSRHNPQRDKCDSKTVERSSAGMKQTMREIKTKRQKIKAKMW